MEIKTKTTEVSSYHNYRYGDLLCREIVAGNPGDGERFFLAALEVSHPEILPNLSLNLFNGKGEKVASLRNNRVAEISADYTAEVKDGNITVRDGMRNEVFRSEVKRYENVTVTVLSGELFDENGKPVSIG